MEGTTTDVVTAATDRMSVSFVGGESYRVRIRDHELVVDQPQDAGGDDSAPSPVELFVASLASCVAFYAGRYLDRHGYSRSALRVTANFDQASDRPNRVGAIRLLVVAPELPASRHAALAAVVSHCTVHNTLLRPPAISIEVG